MVKTLDKAGASTQSNPVKRKKVDDDDSNPASKKRSRVSFSCGECHRRKQKCDRQVPCSHCVARKVPDLCKAYTPGKTEQDISVRLARIEHIIEMALPQYCMPTTPNSSFDPHISEYRQNALEEDNSQPEDQDPSGGTFQSGKWYGNSASGSIAPGTILEQLQNAFTSTDAEDKRLRRDVRLNDIIVNGSSHLSATAIVGSELEPTAADNLKNLVQECGVSPHKISELLHELPPLRTSQFFSNWTRYPISERDFRDAYSSIYNGGDHGISATNPHDVRFLPLLFVVLAIAVRLAPEDVSGDARTRRVTSLRYYWSSRRSLLIAAAIQPDSLDIVLTRLLSARFLTFDRRITECWSQLGAAVRTAQALGLHRDGASMGMEPHLVEYRRRIWQVIPLSCGPFIRSCPGEAKFYSGYIHLNSTAFEHRRRNFESSYSSFFPNADDLFKPSHYSEVTALDDELLNFIANLPPHFALEPDRSLDETHTYIPVHRYLLITEIISDRYARSREACFESALKDFQVRQAFREVQSKEVRDSLSNAYREFQTAMISGIYLVLHPAGKDEAAMHAILDSFMKEHEGIRDMDETTRRELKTIEFLKNKASQRTLPNAIGSLPPNDPAHLLLGLQQSSTPHPPPFPSLLNLPSASSPRSPYATHINQSPTFQRLQSTSGDFENSPTASGSPNGEEDSAAQSLLDHWCNAISAPLEGSSSASSWGGLPGNFAGWAGTTSTLVGAPDPRILAGIDGNEWNYWETLVNQIRGPAPGSN
ncbi:uncharacterized protein ARMOST_05453 [Armillaria ostoyae]|uniref:Zn(2)-C6 fungal-type domain-containing protein n=1 Tax=Armillaria ostoyae TaxID=47428 RepID=A0A284R0A6_ARMOS|nr:uncharacterized protein ARMOST_05453 [Armillaria ostoyae]